MKYSKVKWSLPADQEVKGELMSTQNSGDSDLKRAMFSVSDAVLGAGLLVAIGVYGGGWLDKQFNCAPFLSVGLALLGGALGLARMVMKAKSLSGIKSGNLPPAIGYVDKDQGEAWSFKKSGGAGGSTDSGSTPSTYIASASDAPPRPQKKYEPGQQRMPYDDFD